MKTKLSIPQVAERLSLSARAVKNLLSDGVLGSVKVARASPVLLIATFFLAACQPPAPSGNYTVVDGQAMTPDTYVVIDGGVCVLYAKCTKPDGTVQDTILDTGTITPATGGYAYTSSMGGPGGVMQLAGNGFSWQDYGGGHGGVMNPSWPATFPPCP